MVITLLEQSFGRYRNITFESDACSISINSTFVSNKDQNK